jgi:predicted DNA-binding transcriptional regulator YafY
MLQSYVGSVYEQDLKSAISRLADRLPEVSWVDLQQLAEANVVFRASAAIDLDPVIWRDLETACQERRRVSMVHYNPKRLGEAAREFEPYVLNFNRNNPYVTGFCCLRQEFLDFRVDRIRSLVLQFEAPALEEVMRWVMFYGKGAVVRDPPELVAMVKQEITDMQNQYQ